MVDVSDSPVCVPVTKFVAWSEPEVLKDETNSRKFDPEPVMLETNGEGKRRGRDGRDTAWVAPGGDRALHARPMSAGRSVRPSSAQPIRRSVTELPPKRPSSGRPITGRLPPRPPNSRHAPIDSSLSGGHLPIRRAVSARPVRPGSDRPINRVLTNRQSQTMGRPLDRPMSATLFNRPMSRTLSERPVSRVSLDAPHNRVLPERPIRRALPERPISRTLPETPISKSLPDRAISRGVTENFKNGPMQAYSPTIGDCSSPGLSDLPSRVTSTTMASGLGEAAAGRGLAVWRLQKRKLLRLDDSDHGFFHEGNCYMILWVDPDKDSRRSLHCWTGQSANQRDTERIQKKAMDMERMTGKMALVTMEVQGYESACFLRLFPEGICYLENKGTPVVTVASSYCKRLYQITGRKYARAACVQPSAQTLNSNTIYLLDGSPRMYLWLGSQCDYATKIKALRLTRRIRDVQRKGAARIVIVDETDAKSHGLLVRKLNLYSGVGHVTGPDINTEEVPPPISSDRGSGPPSVNENILYRLSEGNDLDGMSEVTRKPLRGEFLSPEITFLLDSGSHCPVMVWVGDKVARENSLDAINKAKLFVLKKGYSKKVPIVIISQGEEPAIFRRVFISWRNSQGVGNNPVFKAYTAGSMGKTLFSRRDNRPVTKMRVAWPEDSLHGDEGHLEVWRLENGGVKLVPRDQHGVFFNGHCYIVHRPVEQYRPPVIYYWMGSQCPREERLAVLGAAMDMDEALTGTAVLIRVLDGREPSHFLELIQQTMMVYNGRQEDTERGVTLTNMFSVEEVLERNIRVTQIPVSAKCLCSRKAFVIMSAVSCHLWYGKTCGGYEREYAKTLLGFLWPERMYNFQIELEGKESAMFWEAIGGQSVSREVDSPKDYPRREPVLSRFSPETDSFQVVPDFTQEDLTSDAVFILDSFDQVMLWIGNDIDGDTRKNITDIGKRYLEIDPAGREGDRVQLWAIKQHHEPDAFLRQFPTWDASLNTEGERVEMLETLIRQENTVLDVQQEVSPLTLSPLRKENYKTLVQSRDQEGWDNAHKERHLSNPEFLKRLGVSRENFYRFPEWKQKQIRRAARLA